jgi:hypothetical protein
MLMEDYPSFMPTVVDTNNSVPKKLRDICVEMEQTVLRASM